MPISMFGPRGCGKTTLLGLLYQTMEITTVERPNKFRFTQTPEMSRKVQEINDYMLTNKEYPPASTRGTGEELRFLMAFKPTGIKRLSSYARNQILERGEFGNFLGFMASLYDVAGEDVTEFIRSNFRVNRVLKNVFDSEIIVIVIDCSKFTTETDGIKYNKLRGMDGELQTILDGYIQYRTTKKSDEEIHPILFLTKVDALDKEIKNEFPELNKLKESYDENLAKKTAEGLLQKYHRSTYAQMLGSKPVGLQLDEPKYFFSWVEEKKVEGEVQEAGEEKLKVTSGEEGPRNVFPIDIYKAFLNHLNKLVKEDPDPKKRVEKLYKKTKGLRKGRER